MKKVLSLLMVTAFVFAMMASPALAGETSDKVSEGLKQAVTSPTNVPDSISEEYEAADFKPFGLIGGFTKGISMTVIDVVVGLGKVVMLPVDVIADALE